jgi:hypothetical protein
MGTTAWADFDPATLTWTLVHLGAITQIAGFLFRDQLALRWMLLAGNGLYGAYYLLHPATPLWDALAWSVVVVAVNLTMIVVIARSRRQTPLTDDALRLSGAFDRIEPGDFRRLLAVAQTRDVATEHVLTQRGVRPDKLYYVVSGAVDVARRDGRVAVAGGGCFIGEIAFILNGPATATVTVEAGARYYAWDVEVLRALAARREGVAQCLQRAFNRDLAAKMTRPRAAPTPVAVAPRALAG